MTSLRVILGDQLDLDLSALDGVDAARDVVLMAEVVDEATYVPHHKQKLVFCFSAMRHFAETLRGEGLRVDYVRLDDPENRQSLAGEIGRAIQRHRASDVICTEPGEHRVDTMLRDLREVLDIPLHIRADRRFFCSRAEFAQWAGDRKALRMEYFYREMRRRSGLLMRDGQPEGGEWNFDAENRKALPKGYAPPRALRFAPDALTQEVIALVETRFGENFGSLDSFGWPVTRADALLALDDFIAHRLPCFGDYQDAMKAGEAFLHHSLLAPALNAGLLNPREICKRAEAAWRAGDAPLNAVEGFIRQILGWREYVRGIYWLWMPDYAGTNALAATRDLPDFYWTGETDMACMRDCVAATRRHAYAHHIQRLMVTGNFALLAGLAPDQVEEWYLAVYADAYDWVELPNTHGMILFADGGRLGSKPYAASGAYIDRMSDYCAGCRYDVKSKAGPDACPFNYLYWDFLIRNREVLGRNQRLAMPYRNLERMAPERVDEIRADSKRFLNSLKAQERRWARRS